MKSSGIDLESILFMYMYNNSTWFVTAIFSYMYTKCALNFLGKNSSVKYGRVRPGYIILVYYNDYQRPSAVFICFIHVAQKYSCGVLAL